MAEKRIPKLTQPRYERIEEGIYNIQMPPANNQYLVLGKEKALLIDTGFGVGSLKRVVEEITDLPVILVNTHGHPDHAGGNAEFAPALLNPADRDVYEKMANRAFRAEDLSGFTVGEEFIRKLQPDGPATIPVSDGEVLDLGERKITVFYTPGHTHGSLSLFDKQTGCLFTGDDVMAGTTSVSSWESSPVAVLADSLRRMKDYHPGKVLSGHFPNVNDAALIDRVLACCEDILAGVPADIGENTGAPHRYEKEGVSVSYIPDRVR